MKPRSFTSEGIVLAKRNYGEADKILVIYARGHGRVSLIAKGIRKLKSRKRGHIEVFNLIRFQAIAGRGIGLMSEAEVIDDFEEVRGSLKKVSLAYYFMEVVGKITHDGAPNYELYNLLVTSLEKLKTAKELKSLRLNFILSLLTALGFWPKGRPLVNPDEKLEEVMERNLSSFRIGKILSS